MMENALAILISCLCVAASALKLSLNGRKYALGISLAWLVASVLAAPEIASRPLVSPAAIAGGDMWHLLLWCEGMLMLAFCCTRGGQRWIRAALSCFPGVCCGYAFYFMMTYAFSSAFFNNFAVAGIAVGAVAAGMLFGVSRLLRRVFSASTATTLLFALEIFLLLLTALS